MRTLPKWDPAWSDGCSFAPIVTPAVRACCVLHDMAYYYGGSPADKKRADDRLHADLMAAGMSHDMADLFYFMVRKYGHPHGRIPKVSWAFGGERFEYDEQPAVPASEVQV